MLHARRGAIHALSLALAISTLATLAHAQLGPPPKDEPASNQPDLAEKTAQAARNAHAQNLARHQNNPDMLVLPGLLANKKEKWVRLWARATSVSSVDPIEFWAIPTDSGKDYEALAVAFAKPSAVHKALEFIGLQPGRPIDPSQDQLWPKGQRVLMHFEWDPPAGKPTRARAEDLILDINTNKPLPPTGLVFVGSCWIKTEDGGRTLYAADELDQKAIASDFNHRATVLDVPRQALQGSVYGTLKLNPAFRFTPGQPVTITLEPAHKDGPSRLRDLILKISMPAGGENPQAARYVLSDDKNKPLAPGESLIHLLGAFGQLTEQSIDPFVTLHMDDAVPLRSVQGIYTVLQAMDNEQGIRIDAPPPGHLFYRAFFPDPEWRDRTKRLGRPWELHLLEKDHKVAGTLILPADDIDDNDGQGDLKFAVASPEQTAKILAEKSGKFSQTVYIYAPGSMTYGQLMTFIRPSLKTHPTMYIFLPQR